jgi:hypothetical protein
MEDPRQQMQNALKEAMKNKDTVRRDVIRMAQAAIKQVEIDSRKDLSVEETMDVLQKEAKKRRETIAEMEKAGRESQAEQERAELAVLEHFLPQQLSEAEIAVIVSEVIAETGAESPKDTGKVMGPVMQRVKGVADGGTVSRIVREQLNARQS